MRTSACVILFGVLLTLELSESTLYRDGQIVLWHEPDHLDFEKAQERCQGESGKLVELRNEQEWREVEIELSFLYRY